MSIEDKFDAVRNELPKEESVDPERFEHEARMAELQRGPLKKLLEYTDEREKARSMDLLTGLPNRRAFGEDAGKRLAVVMEYAKFAEHMRLHPEETERRVDEPVDPGDFSLILLDLDKFKAINDNYGHAAGDEVLKRVADILRQNLRPTDVVARHGGEEFVIALTAHDPDSRAVVAKKIRAEIEEAIITYQGKPLKVTTSVGAVKWHLGETLEQLISRADKALYNAKELGRNQVVVADES